MTKRRLWVVFVLLSCVVAVCGAAQSGTTPSKRRATQPRATPPRPPGERLVMRRGKVLYELWRDTSTGKWQERKLVDFSDYPGRDYDWSGPLVSKAGVVLLARSSQITDARDANQEVTLYTWRWGEQGPPQLAKLRVNAGAGGHSTLDCWVPAERLISFTASGTEGYADWYSTRILPNGEVAVKDAADDSEKRMLNAFGPRHFVGAQAYSRDGALYAGFSGKLAIYSRRLKRTRFLDLRGRLPWCVSFSPDNRAIAWLGEVQPRAEPWADTVAAQWGLDYILEMNAIGIVWLESGKTSVWRIDKLPGHERSGVWHDQTVARVRISANKRYLYAPWGEDLARFDMKARRMTVIAKHVDGFDVVYQ